MATQFIFAGLILFSTSYACRADALADYRNALDFCAGQNLAKLDDMVSPANMVADAMLVLCQQQTRQAFAKVSSSQPSAYWVGYHQGATKQFAIYVLQHRAALRQPR